MTGVGAALAPVVAVVGPSGVGKDSVMGAVCAARPDIELVRRVITRAPEAGGEVYSPVSEPEFLDMQGQGAFALSWAAHGLHYGIPVSIDLQRTRAAAVLVNLSRSVLHQAQDRFGDLIVISLTVPQAVLAQRLQARGRETADVQADRLSRAGLALPEGLRQVHQIDNSGALEQTVQAVLSVLPPMSPPARAPERA